MSQFFEKNHTRETQKIFKKLSLARYDIVRHAKVSIKLKLHQIYFQPQTPFPRLPVLLEMRIFPPFVTTFDVYGVKFWAPRFSGFQY